MLLILLKLKGMVEKYYKNYENELKEDLLSHTNWKKFRTIKDFLTPFSRAILVIKGDSVSIDRTLFIINILIKDF